MVDNPEVVGNIPEFESIPSAAVDDQPNTRNRERPRSALVRCAVFWYSWLVVGFGSSERLLLRYTTRFFTSARLFKYLPVSWKHAAV